MEIKWKNCLYELYIYKVVEINLRSFVCQQHIKSLN